MSDGVGSKVEAVKGASRQLRGSLAEELRSPSNGFVPDSTLVLKFHGIYQQDDRDVRRQRKQAGLDIESICMVRVSVPGGALTGAQYLAMDDLADTIGDGGLRITSRQGIQYHFVDKADLPVLVGTLNQHLMTTFGACGDVVRNTTCCPAPLPDRVRSGLHDHAQAVARRFRPRTSAYYELWMHGERAVTAEAPPPAPGPVSGPAPGDGRHHDTAHHDAPHHGHGDDVGEEPLYRTVYLPRKFKIGFAFPGDNCIDVYSNDVGVVPVLDGETISRFTLLVGGGMGKSHTNPDTFPRMATPLTTIEADELMEVLEAIVCLHRDHGDRSDRDHARLKYLVEDWGIDRFRKELDLSLGRQVPLPEPVHFDRADDHLGWHRQDDGRWFLGIKVENGRIYDTDAVQVRRGLRAVVERFTPDVRFTSREDILLTDLADEDRAGVTAVLAAHGVVPAEQWVPLKRNSFACPALPTCGLALTESERVLPAVLDEIEACLVELGLADLDVHVRMTGCPNGCARPYTAEIGLVGRGKSSYDIHLGGEAIGLRMNQVFAENVPRAELAGVVRPVLVLYRDERRPGEGFGDFCLRRGVDALRASHGTERWVRVRGGAART